MTIAERLTQTMEPLLDAVYAAGKLTDTYYLPGSLPFKEMFYKAAFPTGYCLTIKTETAPNSLQSMFRVCTGLQKLTMDIPTSQALDGSYFVMGSSNVTSALEELVLPDGIKFSNFICFAQAAKNLQTITGSIDLSESTSNDSCFVSCIELTEVRFVGQSITKSIYFKQSSKLSNDSIYSIVSGLADLTGQTTQTLTVHATVKSRIEELGLDSVIAYDKNWTLVS